PAAARTGLLRVGAGRHLGERSPQLVRRESQVAVHDPKERVVAGGGGRRRESQCDADHQGRGGSPDDRHPTRADWPPSTGRSTPLMNRASSEARKSAAFATSQALPIPPFSGTVLSRSTMYSSRSMPNSRAAASTPIGVLIRPGRIAFTRIPCGAYAPASACVIAFIAAFDIL